MRLSEVKRMAEDLCAKYGINDYPVGIIQLCNENGLKVFEEYLESGVSGMLIVDEEAWPKYGTNQFILINLMESAVRRRFTIAHELAHFVMHRNGSKWFAHRDLTADGASRSHMEREADYFAANILMPEKLVKDKIEDLRSGLGKTLPSFVLVREIADHFVVSESAAEVRLKQIGII